MGDTTAEWMDVKRTKEEWDEFYAAEFEKVRAQARQATQEREAAAQAAGTPAPATTTGGRVPSCEELHDFVLEYIGPKLADDVQFSAGLMLTADLTTAIFNFAAVGRRGTVKIMPTMDGVNDLFKRHEGTAPDGLPLVEYKFGIYVNLAKVISVDGKKALIEGLDRVLYLLQLGVDPEVS